MNHVFGYRKEIIMGNLDIAFPEKTVLEKKEITRQFYINFTDTFIETLKALSMSDAEFDKRGTPVNFDAINKIIADGKNIYLVGAHIFNWEYANLVLSKHINIAPIGVYAKIENKAFDKIILKLRTRFGANYIATHAFKALIPQLTKNQYCMFLLGDQNPSLDNSIWINFFNKPTPFIPGLHKAAIKNNASMVFINVIKTRRGFYDFSAETIIDNAADFSVEELIKKYRNFVEDIIRRQPTSYLWSHRRWKYDFKKLQNKHGGEIVAD